MEDKLLPLLPELVEIVILDQFGGDQLTAVVCTIDACPVGRYRWTEAMLGMPLLDKTAPVARIFLELQHGRSSSRNCLSDRLNAGGTGEATHTKARALPARIDRRHEEAVILLPF